MMQDNEAIRWIIIITVMQPISVMKQIPSEMLK